MQQIYSDLVTIAYAKDTETITDCQELAVFLATELCNADLKSQCLSVNSLTKPNKKNQEESPKEDSDISCRLLSIAKGDLDDVTHDACYNTIVFIFENSIQQHDLSILISTLNDLICDFRVSKTILKNLKTIFVIHSHDQCEPNDDLKHLLLQATKMLNKLGATKLLDEIFVFNKSDFGQILSLVNRIKESHELDPDPVPASCNLNLNDTYKDDESDDMTDLMSSDDIENLGSLSKSMVSETQRKQLTKQGYKLIGNHSAVKLCRWTKSRVRGHGGCYKHTLYGIKSNQCMEMTPSLACANKCVFCWRHHTNPVATSWKWKEDQPEYIAEESLKAHLRLIKELRGIFDVKSERYQEAQTVRHCALSLVGEPIMYPQINELLTELHDRHISSFLVTNAQFPEEMEKLSPVTQLYLSIDAADDVSLKKIDRPLFRDYWRRFEKCIELLKYRKERTVFRMTLVRHFNMSDQMGELEGYARLIKMGEPDFVEIKAVTFCGTVHDNAITMNNVPWHDEVIKYAKALVNITEYNREHYDIACEHRHSCCVLIAKKIFFVNGKWHTWIDYDKFNNLVTSGVAINALDYSIETPSWAIFGAPEQGFDPVDTRIYTKGRKKLNKDLSVTLNL
ncbi:bifunctional Radical SAM/S-adenosyl-L-methionine-dependent tRNA 4-demethylwyosine synthase/tRNA wybutosine-synthesis/Aldolase-type TIM barrel [Babesia duncani]|uniref:Bifunctional Radical SAM/S-adenosyl-L-methionine-dependent tRNA 4-demethylwyosine synthase/tRNA wybutosine-synthesis/Aldolase-type TIM barrel n=1 Tax=Babesia duncani TaxID=323732 RepID=A0AAD9PLK8_9APIC|nr:bifunctional Radical SAM/S-adenosyl-L-methionine-dependent tRNA 4-demethylwyosine synthase/tRNA wybutosine-synthesis/Aldolase-type TIM barrel [Babesia duncani]